MPLTPAIDKASIVFKTDDLDKESKLETFRVLLTHLDKEEMRDVLRYFDADYMYRQTGNGFYALKWYAINEKSLPPDNAIYSIDDFVLALRIMDINTVANDIVQANIDIDHRFNANENEILPLLEYTKTCSRYVPLISKIGARVSIQDWTASTILKNHPLLINNLLTDALLLETRPQKIEVPIKPWVQTLLKYSNPMELAAFYSDEEAGKNAYIYYYGVFHECMEQHPLYKDACSMAMLTNTSVWTLVKTMYTPQHVSAPDLDFANIHLD